MYNVCQGMFDYMRLCVYMCASVLDFRKICVKSFIGVVWVCKCKYMRVWMTVCINEVVYM